jgi:hypothetical protein
MIRKTPLTRTAFKRADLPKEPKRRLRKCAVCRTPFQPRSMTHKACKPECAAAHIAAEKARKDKRERQEGLAKLKRRADYLKEAQVAFNRFIRLRDQLAGHTCISSGRPLDWTGNAVDAGHYRSTGSAPHLRFNEDNCHAQSKHDNQWKSGNAVDYRIRLIQRIGLRRVEALEADDTPRKWSIDDLKAIKAHYTQKLKQLRETA